MVDATVSEVADPSRLHALVRVERLPFVRSHTWLLWILRALAFGVYSRETSQYDERIRAFMLK